MVKRRKFMIGIGALAAGSGAAMGTGAFDAASMDRDGNINVVADDQGLLALQSNTPSDVVRLNNDGELVIDFTADGNAGGVNVDSRYRVGEFAEFPPGQVDLLGGPSGSPVTYTDPAFSIVNQDTVAHDVTLEYTVTGNISGSQIYFQLQDEDDGPLTAGSGNTNGDVSGEILIPNAAGRDNSTTVTLSPGERVGVSFQVDTGDGGTQFFDADGSTTEDLSGTLDVTAN